MGRKVGLCAFVYLTTSGDEAHAPVETTKSCGKPLWLLFKTNFKELDAKYYVFSRFLTFWI